MRWTALCALAYLVADPAAAQTGGPTASGEGGWEWRRPAGGSAGAPDCILTPKQRSRIQVGRDRLIVSGLPRDSIFNYQYRIDDKPASNPIRPSDVMQKDGAVSLEGAAFDEVMAGRRFRIRILDRWHEAIAEDVDLAGLGDLHRTMIAACR